MQNTGLRNFRDLGGIAAGDKKIANNKLLRCANLGSVTSEDKKWLTEEKKLKHVVDMRSVSEVAALPDPPICGVVNHHFDFFGEASVHSNAPSAEDFMKAVASGIDAEKHMMSAYEGIVLSASGQKGLRDFFDVLLDNEDGSTLWHCSAGKDRTGVSAAIVLEVLGVSREDIMADYLETNNNIEDISKALSKNLGNGVDMNSLPENVRKSMLALAGVKKEYLEHSWALIEKEHGSVLAFVTDVLGVTKAQQEKLKSIYLV